MTNDPRGSTWRKWDLHVHTPVSSQQGYGGDTDEVWERFLCDLEALPDSIKVLGINDYLFVDGYERLLREREVGRLKNIALVLPVIELRLENFVGTEGRWQRVNYHVIFSDKVTPDVIRDQFIGALSNKYKLDPAHVPGGLEWHARPTRASLQELGKMVREASPEGKAPDGSDEQVGFNSLNFSRENIERCLMHHAFKGKYLTAIGKAEWSSMRWNLASIATKRNTINSADIVFTAAQNVGAARRSKEKLASEEVNDHLFDCSDAHHFSDSDQHERIGETFTWVKADPTFEGLKLALHRYDERVYLGSKPPKLDHVAQNRTKYISGVEIRRAQGTNLGEVWFDDIELRFNHGLVAIIGNKGSGKSALTDILSLCGRAKAQDYSFLSKSRFRHPSDNKSSHFEATLLWESGTRITRKLSECVGADEAEQLRYVPQTFFERVTNETAVEETGAFYTELQSVVFSHIPEDRALGFDSLSKLLEHHAGAVEDRLNSERGRLRVLNRRIAELEEETSEESVGRLEAQIAAKRDEEKALIESPPDERTAPNEQSQNALRLQELREAIGAIGEEVNKVSANLTSTRRKRDTAAKVLNRLALLAQEFTREHDDSMRELAAAGIDLKTDALAKANLTIRPLQEFIDDAETRIAELILQQDVETHGTVANAYATAKRDIDQIGQRLETADREYQECLERKQKWTDTLAAVVGSEDTPGSLRYLVKKRKDLREVKSAELISSRKARDEAVLSIAKHLHGLRDIYETLAAPIKESIAQHPLLQEGYKLTFEVPIVDTGFEADFLRLINQARKGSFIGKIEGAELVEDLLSTHDFETKEGLLRFVHDVMDHLQRNYGDDSPSPNSLVKQLAKGISPVDVYDQVFSLEYLAPRYALKLDGKDIGRLSPGERGVLLLIFYLLLDKSERPLVIDQPEENLDNESVYDLLVPGVRDAKERRQLFIVTHNPNLAVVCDADQVVRASIDKDGSNRVTYTAGALENPEFNMHVINVLEGTLPALKVRMGSYEQSM